MLSRRFQCHGANCALLCSWRRNSFRFVVHAVTTRMQAKKIAPKSPHRKGLQTKQAIARQERRLGSWSVLPDGVGFSRSAVLGGADALPEQPHPVLLSRANHLAFRAKNRETQVGGLLSARANAPNQSVDFAFVFCWRRSALGSRQLCLMTQLAPQNRRCRNNARGFLFQTNGAPRCELFAG